MKKIITLALGLVLTGSISQQAQAQSILIDNVHGYTLQDGELTQFTALQLQDDHISALYRSEQAKPSGDDIQRIDGMGHTLLPGLIDAHGHVLSYGLSLMRADLVDTSSEQDAVSRVLSFHKQNPNSHWLLGRGWNQVQWPDKQFPTAASLDKYFPNSPVWLKRIDGHAGWANSKAMALAGINKHTKTPSGGEILKDSKGNPTGIFVDNAMTLIDNAIPALTIEEQQSVLLKAMKTLAAQGLTSVHDAGISVDNINAYLALSATHKMPIRINAMLDITAAGADKILAQGPMHSDDDFFALHSVKIISDGALGSRGAAMEQDYSDQPHHRGLLLHSDEQLYHYIETAMQHGFQVNTHAIGDRANHLLLNDYEKLIAKTDSKALRHRIEHAQIIEPEDIPRFAKLGVIASMQATHATSDKNMAETRIGRERLRGAYAWRTLLDSGAIIANGSDFPVEPANPFYGLHAAITRQDRQNQPKGGWMPEQKMTRLEAFRSFTEDAAYAGHQEQIIGTLEPGKKADFILINDDLFQQPQQDIWKDQVLETWVNGKRVYQR